PLPVLVSVTNAIVEIDFQKIVADDDAAQAEVDGWLRKNDELKAKGAPESEATLKRRIQERFDLIRKNYQDFLARNSNHVRARLAYGNFLNDRQDERGAQAQWEK